MGGAIKTEGQKNQAKPRAHERQKRSQVPTKDGVRHALEQKAATQVAGSSQEYRCICVK